MKQERTLKQIAITLDNVNNQCQIVLDYMGELVKDNPEHDTYFKLLDYIANSLYDVQEKLKTL